MNYKPVKKSFEKSIKSYDKNAVVQNLTAEYLVDELSKISDTFENILETGCGTGLLTKKIAKKLKFKTFSANDLVGKFKPEILKIIPDATFICGNALKIKRAKKFDLIISNAMFQWFENPDKAVRTLKLSLCEDGILAFTTFSPENFKEIREITGLTLNYKTVDELKKILTEAGFEILYCSSFNKEIQFNTELELLAHMKKTGVNSLSPKKWTFTDVKDFCNKIRETQNPPKLTYSPIIIICRKIN